jgi:hypothetical protein
MSGFFHGDEASHPHRLQLQAQVQLQSRIDTVRRFACDQALVTDAGASSGQRTRMRQGLRW